MKAKWRVWLVDVAAGGLVGAIAGGIVAVNLVIYFGVERGYEADLSEVFERSVLLGVLVVAILIGGPIVGVLTAHIQRMKRSNTQRPSH